MAKVAGTVKGKAKTGAKKTAGKKVPKVNPQLKSDPAFMKNVETAMRDEIRKSGTARRKPAQAVENDSGDDEHLEPAREAVRKVRTKGGNAESPRDTDADAKPPKAGTSKSEKAERAALAKELSALIPRLDSEGLSFLVEQAQTHLYNLKVLELEAEGDKLDKASARAKAAERNPAARAGSGSDYRIERSTDGSTYHVVHNGKWKMFAESEMLAMVRIISAKDPVPTLAGRLYRYFLMERSDVFQDIGISSPVDPNLKALVNLLKKTFAIKKD